jgi:hypothetical protein
MARWWHGRLTVELGVSPAESGPHDCVMLRWQALRRAGSGTQRAPHGSVPLPSGEFGHIRRDRRFPERPGDRDPVLAVGDVVATVQPVGLNGGSASPWPSATTSA